MKTDPSPPRTRWLNRTVVGVGLASLFSDWSHEIATTIMPAFLATMGVAAAWLGLIEGVWLHRLRWNTGKNPEATWSRPGIG
jgi:hypothetical protein